MAALGRIYVAYEGVTGIGAKPGVDGAWLYQADVHAAALELEAQGVGVAFQCELAGVVGAAILHGHQAKHRAVLHYPPLAHGQHGRQHLTNEMVPAKQIGVELRLERLRRQVFQRAGLAVGAVVEEPEQASPGQRQRLCRPPLYAGGVRQIQLHSQETLLLQLGDILDLAGGGDHGEAVGAERLGGGEADAAGAAGDKHEGVGHEDHPDWRPAQGRSRHGSPSATKNKTGPRGPVFGQNRCLIT